MALILADTDVLIDYLAGIEPVTRQVASYVVAEQLQTSAITSFELLSGARAGRRGERVRLLVAGLPVLPVDRAAAERAAELRQQLERTGSAIGMADSLIAGIALANALPLLTRNRKHFARIENLRLVDLEHAGS